MRLLLIIFILLCFFGGPIFCQEPPSPVVIPDDYLPGDLVETDTTTVDSDTTWYLAQKLYQEHELAMRAIRVEDMREELAHEISHEVELGIYRIFNSAERTKDHFIIDKVVAERLTNRLLELIKEKYKPGRL